MVFFLVLFFQKMMYEKAFIIYVAASATDALDGFIARKYKLITPLGKLLDPLADKLMLVTVLVCMYLAKRLPLWILLLIFVKEVLQVVGSLVMYKKRDTVVQANIFGKATTVLFSISVILLFLHDLVEPFDTYAIMFTAAFAIFSLLQYVYKYNSVNNPKKINEQVSTSDQLLSNKKVDQ